MLRKPLYTSKPEHNQLYTTTKERFARLGFDVYGYFSKQLFKASPLFQTNPELADIIQNSVRVEAYHDNHDTQIPATHIYIDNQPLLIIRPYYWGNNPNQKKLPNLEIHQPSERPIRVSWYRYALRNARSTYPLCPNTINHLFDYIEKQMCESLAHSQKQAG